MAVPFDGQTWRAAEAPPPVTGGHLAVLDDAIAVADPDLRALVVVDAAQRQVHARYALPGEPGRVAVHGGRVHVVLRDIGAIASLDAAAGRLETRPVCAAPRGLAWDAASESLFVACLDGRVQRLAASGGEPQTFARIPGGDLRDVVAQPEGLWVTQLRSATAVLLSRDGDVLHTVRIPQEDTPEDVRAASIAWRAVARPGGGILVSHQRHSRRAVSTVVPEPEPFAPAPSTYGGGFDPSTGACVPPLVTSALTAIRADGTVEWTGATFGALPVDVAVQGELAWVASAAVARDLSSAVQAVVGSQLEAGTGCGGGALVERLERVEGQAVSVAHLGDDLGDGLVVHTRFPSALVVHGERVLLADTRGDVGHALFHAGTSSSLACASCHPEGGEDGVAWTFFGIGTRRTQELRGGLLATAPFHWDGDMPSLDAIMTDVFGGRMGGGAPTDAQLEAVAGWLDALPLPVLDAHADAERGRAVFEREGCADCHAGALLTNNDFADFGRGRVQVPTLLGVSHRGPWMRDGCARSLETAIVDSCAGDAHGASTLAGEDLEALLGYLRTL